MIWSQPGENGSNGTLFPIFAPITTMEMSRKAFRIDAMRRRLAR